MADDDQVEITLVQLPSCHVFRIPPRTTAQKYRASEWKDKVWHGRLKIVQKGKEAAVILIDAENQVYCVCPIKEGAIETVADSSRYFVLRIQNAQGRHAFIGLAFNDRNHAFDFNVALQEFQKDVEREAKILQQGDEPETSEPSRNFAIPAGEKISVSLKTGGGGRRAKKSGGGGGGAFLAPPPGDTPSRRTGGSSAKHSSADALISSSSDDSFHDLSATSAVSSSRGGDLFDIDMSGPAPAAPAVAPAATSAPLDVFGGSGFDFTSPAPLSAFPAPAPAPAADPFGSASSVPLASYAAKPAAVRSPLDDLTGLGTTLPYTSPMNPRPMAAAPTQMPMMPSAGGYGYGMNPAPMGMGMGMPPQPQTQPMYGAPPANVFGSFNAMGGGMGQQAQVPQPQQARPPAAGATRDPFDFLMS